MPKKVKRKKGRVIWKLDTLHGKSWKPETKKKFMERCNKWFGTGNFKAVKFVECLTD